ncbi:ATG16 [Scenedesmus sp. PABB004]|nr:ATG16 [Scenedesmus sp. PABB004]
MRPHLGLELSWRWRPAAQPAQPAHAPEHAAPAAAPLVVLLPWIGAAAEHVDKYVALAHGSGWDALVAAWPAAAMWSAAWSRALAARLLAALDAELRARGERPLVLWAFSGAARGVLASALELLAGRHALPAPAAAGAARVLRCCAGAVLDSCPVDFTSEAGKRLLAPRAYGGEPAPAAAPPPRGARAAAAAAAAWGVGLGAGLLDFVLLEAFERHREAMWTALEASLPGPVLLLYSRSDTMADAAQIAGLAAALRRRGRTVMEQVWQDSGHCQHYRLDPQVYREAVQHLLAQALLEWEARSSRAREGRHLAARWRSDPDEQQLARQPVRGAAAAPAQRPQAPRQRRQQRPRAAMRTRRAAQREAAQGAVVAAAVAAAATLHDAWSLLLAHPAVCEDVGVVAKLLATSRATRAAVDTQCWGLRIGWHHARAASFADCWLPRHAHILAALDIGFRPNTAAVAAALRTAAAVRPLRLHGFSLHDHAAPAAALLRELPASLTSLGIVLDEGRNASHLPRLAAALSRLTALRTLHLSDEAMPMGKEVQRLLPALAGHRQLTSLYVDTQDGLGALPASLVELELADGFAHKTPDPKFDLHHLTALTRLTYIAGVGDALPPSLEALEVVAIMDVGPLLALSRLRELRLPYARDVPALELGRLTALARLSSVALDYTQTWYEGALDISEALLAAARVWPRLPLVGLSAPLVSALLPHLLQLRGLTMLELLGTAEEGELPSAAELAAALGQLTALRTLNLRGILVPPLAQAAASLAPVTAALSRLPSLDSFGLFGSPGVFDVAAAEAFAPPATTKLCFECCRIDDAALCAVANRLPGLMSLSVYDDDSALTGATLPVLCERLTQLTCLTLPAPAVTLANAHCLSALVRLRELYVYKLAWDELQAVRQAVRKGFVEELQADVWRQVAALRAAQTAPYETLVADYMACLQRNRELEVRVGVLDKEVAELRDEAGSLQHRLAAFDEAAVRDFAAKAESYRADLARANSELTSLLRDKSKAYEELLALQRTVAALSASQAEAAEAAELAEGEIGGLKARLAELSQELDAERQARQLAAAEAEARVAAKVAAEAESERLRADNLQMEGQLRQMVAKEAERLEQISRMHEELMVNTKRQQTEASAASQLMGLLTRRRGSATSSSSAAASAAPSPGGGASAPASRRGSAADAAGSAAAAAAAAEEHEHAQEMWSSLKQRMGLPELPVGPIKERELPQQPAKAVQVCAALRPAAARRPRRRARAGRSPTGRPAPHHPRAAPRPAQAHAGGVCSLAFQPHGQLVASCGMDKTVQSWSLTHAAHVSTYQGMQGSVNDVAFNADGRRLLGAGSDKRLLVWNTHGGQVVHTLTGHANAVSCVAASPLDEGLAVSAGEDRCLKVWDLVRGYASRSIPCTKMPTALTLSADGSTIITGHLDGTLCLWDLRQSRAGSQPLAEVRRRQRRCAARAAERDSCRGAAGSAAAAAAAAAAQVRDHAQAVLCVTPTPNADWLLTASKDNQLRLWDFRQLGTVQARRRAPARSLAAAPGAPRRVWPPLAPPARGGAATPAAAAAALQVLKAPHFSIGHIGSMGRSKCHAEMSADGRWVAAGAADGQVFVWELRGAPGAAAGARALRHHKDAAVAAGWSADCTELVTADKAGGIAFWRLHSHTVLRQPRPARHARSPARAEQQQRCRPPLAAAAAGPPPQPPRRSPPAASRERRPIAARSPPPPRRAAAAAAGAAGSTTPRRAAAMEAEAPAPAVVFVSHEEVKSSVSNRKLLKVFLVDAGGTKHLAATGEDLGDAHYHYRSTPPFARFGPLDCKNRRELSMWLEMVIAESGGHREGPHLNADAEHPEGIYFTSHKIERAFYPDGRRCNRWYLLDQRGEPHLAVIGIERDTKDGHYVYSAEEPFASIVPLNCSNQSGVFKWLERMITHHAGGDAAPAVPAASGAASGGAAGAGDPAARRAPPVLHLSTIRAARRSAAALASLEQAVVVEGNVARPKPKPATPAAAALPPLAAPPTAKHKSVSVAAQTQVKKARKAVEDVRAEEERLHAAHLARLRRAAAAEVGGDTAAKAATLAWLHGALTHEEGEHLGHWVGLLTAVLELQSRAGGAVDAGAGAARSPSKSPAGKAAAGGGAGGGEGKPPPAGGAPPAESDVMVWIAQPANARHHLRVALECLKELGATDLPARVLLQRELIPLVRRCLGWRHAAVAGMARRLLGRWAWQLGGHLHIASCPDYMDDHLAGLECEIAAGTVPLPQLPKHKQALLNTPKPQQAAHATPAPPKSAAAGQGGGGAAGPAQQAAPASAPPALGGGAAAPGLTFAGFAGGAPGPGFVLAVGAGTPGLPGLAAPGAFFTPLAASPALQAAALNRAPSPSGLRGTGARGLPGLAAAAAGTPAGVFAPPGGARAPGASSPGLVDPAAAGFAGGAAWGGSSPDLAAMAAAAAAVQAGGGGGAAAAADPQQQQLAAAAHRQQQQQMLAWQQDQQQTQQQTAAAAAAWGGQAPAALPAGSSGGGGAAAGGSSGGAAAAPPPAQG